MDHPSNIIYQQRHRGTTVEVIEKDGLRCLTFGSHLRQSCMLLDDPSFLFLPYSRHMMSALLFLPHFPKRILLIGLGGGSLVKFFLHNTPQAHVEVVEYDPHILAVAQDFFHLPKGHQQLTVHLGDGAHFFDKGEPKQSPYDLILLDAFDSHGLVTSIYQPPFLKTCQNHLAPGGVIAANVSRGNKPHFQEALENWKIAYPEQGWMIPVARSQNAILIATPKRPAQPPYKPTVHHAKGLSQRLPLNFTPLLERAQPIHDSMWQRVAKVLTQNA
ncbi:fused MFS/spermidine synthase [Magnetococcus sp. PR-3]|uniref:fused MFS/spermidine synthase n=1 Tax=Magnetococcus sp. PR-3 TaxID=3120355 RepID=UPI002FCE4505